MDTSPAFLGEVKQPNNAILLADEDEWESKEEFKQRLTELLQQMMFVSGETGEPSAETTGMIEEIVRQQVIEIVRTISPPLQV